MLRNELYERDASELVRSSPHSLAKPALNMLRSISGSPLFTVILAFQLDLKTLSVTVGEAPTICMAGKPSVIVNPWSAAAAVSPFINFTHSPCIPLMGLRMEVTPAPPLERTIMSLLIKSTVSL